MMLTFALAMLITDVIGRYYEPPRFIRCFRRCAMLRYFRYAAINVFAVACHTLCCRVVATDQTE